MVALLEGADAPEIVNVCTGVGTTLLDACQLIAGALGSACEPEVIGGYRPGDMRHCLGRPDVLANLLGRPPRSLSDAVDDAFTEPRPVGV
jgi:hypothetical protein